MLPMHNYNYSPVLGACCENVTDCIPIPFGIAGPLNIDGEFVHIPMATAEGTFVASTSRGCKALNAGGGVSTVTSTLRTPTQSHPRDPKEQREDGGSTQVIPFQCAR